MITLNEFVTKYNGQKVDYDKFYGPQCFTKDHYVLMSDWTYKAIQDIQVGDKVIGYDNNVNTVTQVFKSIKKVVHIKTELCDFYVTPDHPFYFKDGTFSPAMNLITKSPALYDKENFAPSGLTDNELLFLGFWLGDGNIAKHKDERTDEIRITYGLKKADFIHSLNIISTERLHHETNNAFVASIRKMEHPLLTKIILEKCAGEYKKLPLIFNNRESELILKGLIHADGSLHHNSYVITNTSPALLYAAQAICIKLGYKTKSVRLSKRSSDYIKIKGKLIKSVKPLYRFTINTNLKTTHNEQIEIGEPFEAEVFNLETDNTHTYICNNYKVHNCVDLFRQYCQDVVGCGHTGSVEGAKDLYLNYNKLPKEKESFTRIANPKNPKPGDVAVWGESSTNKYGHVAIIIGTLNDDLIVFEQDGFKQDGAKINLRGRNNFLGVLRPTRGGK